MLVRWSASSSYTSMSGVRILPTLYLSVLEMDLAGLFKEFSAVSNGSDLDGRPHNDRTCPT